MAHHKMIYIQFEKHLLSIHLFNKYLLAGGAELGKGKRDK